MATRVQTTATFDAAPTMKTLRAPTTPLEAISERRWFILGSLAANMLVWTRVTNAAAWIGFLAILGVAAGWLIYGSALSGRSRSKAMVLSTFGMVSLVAVGILAAAAIGYADYTGAPGWAYGVIYGFLVVVVAAASWVITAPLRAKSRRCATGALPASG